MCTSQQTSADDDVWGDSSEEEHGIVNHQRDLEREGNARQQTYYNAGYRDGLDTGKERTLQHGFNIGFAEGAAAGYSWGEIKAAVKTLDILCGQIQGTSSWRSQVDALSSHVSSIKDRDAMLGAVKQLLDQPLKMPEATSDIMQQPEITAACQSAALQPTGGLQDTEELALAILPDMQREVHDATRSLQHILGVEYGTGSRAQHQAGAGT